MRLLFVCLGNICRSPLAEYLAKNAAKKLAISCHIESAGTSGWHDGEKMHPKSSAILGCLGILHDDFRSRKLTLQMCERADYICVMDAQNEQNITQSFANTKHKIIHLAHLIGLDEIADPWYTNDFERTKDELERAISALFCKLAQKP